MPFGHSPRPFPVRQVSRLENELHFAGIENLKTLSPGRYERGIVLMGLARYGLSDWFAGNRLRRPDELACFSSINNLAASFGRPFETVRRHVRALVAEGTCVEDARGVAIGTDRAVAERLLAYLRLTHDALLGMAEDLAALGLLPRCPAPARGPMTRAITAAGLDIQLLPLENYREAMPDWVPMLVWSAFSGLCVRHVTTDPALSERYARDSTPDEERRPVTVRRVAELTGLPYSSVWRHAKAIEAAGGIRAKGDGFIVSTDYLRGPAVDERVAASAVYHHRRIAELVRQGLDPAAPMPYLARRPYAAPDAVSQIG